MDFEQWKKTYPTAEDFYDAYVNSEEGKERWNEAHESYPDSNDGGEDMDFAADYIIEGMQYFMYDAFEDESLHDQFKEWFDDQENDLRQNIF
jgi:hypothetical protein